ncbi:MAG: hypothetical protein FWE23_11210 [Chitinivibrionia bacterium]|nr:hypothetical protein [Chitinivibrionia bacterium]
MQLKRGFVMLAVASAMTVFMGCGNRGASTAPAQAQRGEQSPFGAVFEAPCTIHDCNEWFAATGIANGSRARMDVLQRAALTNAQNMIRQKMQHAYEGMVEDYNRITGNNQGSDADMDLEADGRQIMDLIVNNTFTVCGPKFSSVDERGHVSCFIGIRISKVDMANQMVDMIENKVSNSERERIALQRANFRERSLAAVREARGN